MENANDRTYKVLIVDDEFYARRLLTDYVSKLESLSLVRACSSALEALAVLQRERVDILLVDIQMPEMTGLELVRHLSDPPAVIFTTAYSEHALESYELEAVDYLLKPIALPRFVQAIDKAVGRIDLSTDRQTETGEGGAGESRLTSLTPDYLIVKSGHKLFKINYPELLYIEGQREYVTFHTVNRRVTAYYSLKDLEEELPREQFLRIHKSYIVSFRSIESLEGNTVTVAGIDLPVGGNYREALMQRLMPGS